MSLITLTLNSIMGTALSPAQIQAFDSEAVFFRAIDGSSCQVRAFDSNFNGIVGVNIDAVKTLITDAGGSSLKITVSEREGTTLPAPKEYVLPVASMSVSDMTTFVYLRRNRYGFKGDLTMSALQTMLDSVSPLSASTAKSDFSRKQAVINVVDNTLAPPTEVEGARYIIDGTGASHANWDGGTAWSIMQFDGTNWIETIPEEGWRVYVDILNEDHECINDGVLMWQKAVDQTGAEIKVAYEAESDTNAFTDADKSTLDGFSAGVHGKSYTFISRGASSGVNFLAGFYDAPAAAGTISDATAPSLMRGTANGAYGAHAFIVASAAGATNGSDLIMTVTGTSITDAGVRTAGDSEVVVADCTALATDDYRETTKKWIGQVTFTLSSTAGTIYDFTFNFGLAKYEDFGNQDFVVRALESNGLGNANDPGVDIALCKHAQTGWTYHATAFVPGNGVVTSMADTYGTESNVFSGEQFGFDRTGLSEAVSGSTNEGILIMVTTSVNNSITFLNVHLEVSVS